MHLIYKAVTSQLLAHWVLKWVRIPFQNRRTNVQHILDPKGF